MSSAAVVIGALRVNTFKNLQNLETMTDVLKKICDKIWRTEGLILWSQSLIITLSNQEVHDGPKLLR